MPSPLRDALRTTCNACVRFWLFCFVFLGLFHVLKSQNLAHLATAFNLQTNYSKVFLVDLSQYCF